MWSIVLLVMVPTGTRQITRTDTGRMIATRSIVVVARIVMARSTMTGIFVAKSVVKDNHNWWWRMRKRISRPPNHEELWQGGV
jgi:hypothetical protein